jgi:NAD(P)-dependent dehydrogenase (short-subunit alcohol dehydrogenase family)
MRLDGRVVIVTGAGRGLGREHARLMASEGARVVVNDVGSDVHGAGADGSPAQQVVAEIEAAGGVAVASGHDVADWDSAAALIELAVESFGRLDVLVNNAGIVRDRTFANLSEAEWDAVLRVQLKGSAAPTRHALAHWRARAKGGEEDVRASVIFTSSIAGLVGNFGQANYSAAKLAVLALARVVSLEAGRYGVRANCVSPSARTRISMTIPGVEEGVPEGFDPLDPAHVSPVVAWLAASDCRADGQVLHVHGDQLLMFALPEIHHRLSVDGRRWTLDDLDREVGPKLITPLTLTEI